MIHMAAEKSAEQTTPEQGGKHHRAASKPNEQGYACPECWVVPETVRNDGVSTARHLPGNPSARLFRDTEFCNGQGRTSRFVLDEGWAPGSEPQTSISATEHAEHGTSKHEARQTTRAQRQEATAARQAAQKAKPKAKAPVKKKAPSRAKKPASKKKPS